MASTFIKLHTMINDGKISSCLTWSSDKIQTEINSAVGALGSNNVRSTRFSTISSGTSGALSIPGAQSIILDDFGGTTDAIITKVVAGKPSFESVLDSSGNIVATTFDSSGNYSLTGTPQSYPVAIIYRVRTAFSDYDDTDSDIVGSSYIEKRNQFISSYQTTQQTNIISPVPVIFDVQEFNTDTSIFSYNTSTGVLEFLQFGSFEIIYKVGADVSSNARTSGTSFVEIDTGSGFMSLNSKGFGSTYNRNHASGIGEANCHFPHIFSAGDKLRVMFKSESGKPLKTVPNLTNLLVKEI